MLQTTFRGIVARALRSRTLCHELSLLSMIYEPAYEQLTPLTVATDSVLTNQRNASVIQNSRSLTWGNHLFSTATGSTDGSQTEYNTHALTQQQLLLDHALKHVKTLGWSQSALQAAAEELELSPAFAGSLPRGEAQLVEHFIQKCNRDLVSYLRAKEVDWGHLSIQEKLYLAIRQRLELLTPYMSTWPQALSILARPQSAPHALALLHELVNDIWYALGDESTDGSWYTKRLLLAAVYAATELYMLTDYSPGFQDTWEALDRRLKECSAFGQFN